MLKGVVLLLMVLCVGLLAILLWQRRQMGRTFDRLEAMLDLSLIHI